MSSSVTLYCLSRGRVPHLNTELANLAALGPLVSFPQRPCLLLLNAGITGIIVTPFGISLGPKVLKSCPNTCNTSHFPTPKVVFNSCVTPHHMELPVYTAIPINRYYIAFLSLHAICIMVCIKLFVVFHVFTQMEMYPTS